jgi:hypothetical protein
MSVLRALPSTLFWLTATAGVAGDFDWKNQIETPDLTIAEMVPCLNLNPQQRDQCVAHIEGMTSSEYLAMAAACRAILNGETAAICVATLAKLEPQFVVGAPPPFPAFAIKEVAAIEAGCAAVFIYSAKDGCISGVRKLKAIVTKRQPSSVASRQQ